MKKLCELTIRDVKELVNGKRVTVVDAYDSALSVNMENTIVVADPDAGTDGKITIMEQDAGYKMELDSDRLIESIHGNENAIVIRFSNGMGGLDIEIEKNTEKEGNMCQNIKNKVTTLSELLQALKEHNDLEHGYQIQLNSGNLDDKSNKHTDVEFGDLYFTECSTLKDSSILCFDNMKREPTKRKEDGTSCYPIDVNSQMFIDLEKIEFIEDVEDFEDWFIFTSERVVNLYMLPENDDLHGCRNVISIGFMLD